MEKFQGHNGLIEDYSRKVSVKLLSKYVQAINASVHFSHYKTIRDYCQTSYYKGKKRPATMVNKQVFLTQNLAPTISFPYNTAEVQHINTKLSGNKRQGALS